MNDNFDSLPLADGPYIQKIAAGAQNAAFPIWIEEENLVRFIDLATSISPANTKAGTEKAGFDNPVRMLELAYVSGETRIFKANLARVNASVNHPELGIVQGSYDARAIEKAPLVPFMDAEVLIDTFEGGRLNGPYALAIHPYTHDIWFTDPPLGLIKQGPSGARIDFSELGYGRSYVFSLDHHGDLTAQITELSNPTALAFTPDAKHLYVINNRALLPANFGIDSKVFRVLPDEAGPEHIWRFELDAEHRIKKGSAKVFANLKAAGQSQAGLCLICDRDSRLWVGSELGLDIFDENANLIASLNTPEPVTGICFGGFDGSDLIFTSPSGLYRLRTTTGAPPLIPKP